METGKGQLPLLALFILGMIISIVIRVNSWVDNEINQTGSLKQGITQGGKETSQSADINEFKSAQEEFEKKTDQKIPTTSPTSSEEPKAEPIYEMPLEDVILIQ